jgi:hypothetical protein
MCLVEQRSFTQVRKVSLLYAESLSDPLFTLFVLPLCSIHLKLQFTRFGDSEMFLSWQAKASTRSRKVQR